MVKEAWSRVLSRVDRFRARRRRMSQPDALGREKGLPRSRRGAAGLTTAGQSLDGCGAKLL